MQKLSLFFVYMLGLEICVVLLEEVAEYLFYAELGFPPLREIYLPFSYVYITLAATIFVVDKAILKIDEEKFTNFYSRIAEKFQARTKLYLAAVIITGLAVPIVGIVRRMQDELGDSYKHDDVVNGFFYVFSLCCVFYCASLLLRTNDEKE